MTVLDSESKRASKKFIIHNSKFIILSLLVTLVRLSLVGSGTMAFIDERRYVTAMLGLRALGAGHGLEFLQAVNSLGARPGDGLWRAIPGLGQAVLLLGFGLNPNSPASLQVPQVFNVLIMSLNMLLLYRIYCRFLSIGFALLGVALYSSLVNTNVYLRHLLPYDHALFFFLLALALLLAKPVVSLRRQWWVGVLVGFSYAVYPGYFMGPAVLLALSAVIALAPQTAAESRRIGVRLRPVAGQLAGLIAVLGVCELLAQVSDTSYLASSRYIATTITQGSFAEGFSFVGTYFWQVEGWVGGGLLVLFGAGLLLRLRGALRGQLSGPDLPLTGLLVAGFLAWLGYAGLVQFGHALVFYGRTLHFFVPFVVLGAMGALQAAADRWPRSRQLLLAGVGVLALWHFGAFVSTYRAVAYPCDVAYNYGIEDVRQIASNQTTGCDTNVIPYRVFGPRIREQPTKEQPKYQLVNFAYLYPLSCYRPVSALPGRVVVAVPYFMKYPAYQFEGHNRQERELLRTHPYEFRIVTND